MKTIISTMAMLLIANIACTQALPKNSNQLNLGVGISNLGIPLYIGIDHGVSNDISLGLELSYRDFNENNNFSHNVIGFSGNGNYHFNNGRSLKGKFDVYLGLNIGFYVWSSPNNYTGSHNSGLGLGAQVGARYFLSPNVGLNLEFGGGNAFSGGKFGLTFKL